MSTNHESQSLHVENEDELRHATRLNQVNFITTTTAAGLAVGTAITLVLYITLGNTLVTGAATILGGILGGLIGAIILRINKRRRDAELLAILRGSDGEPPESM